MKSAEAKHQEKMDAVDAKHHQEMTASRTKHQREMNIVVDKRQEEIHNAETKYHQDMNTTKAKHQLEMKDVDTKYKQELNNMVVLHNNEVANLKNLNPIILVNFTKSIFLVPNLVNLTWFSLPTEITTLVSSKITILLGKTKYFFNKIQIPICMTNFSDSITVWLKDVCAMVEDMYEYTYDQITKLALLDPYILQFENKFTEQVGEIPNGFFNKFVLLIWVIFVIKFTLKILLFLAGVIWKVVKVSFYFNLYICTNSFAVTLPLNY